MNPARSTTIVRRRRSFWPLVVLALLLCIWPENAQVVGAQAAVSQRDHVQLVGLVIDAQEAQDVAVSQETAGAVRFEVALNYRLHSVPGGFLLLFVLENDSQRSAQERSDGRPVASGDGHTTVHTVYQPRAGVEAVKLVVGLFASDETLLAWTITNPVSLDPLPSRAAFAKAMQARRDGDDARSINHLSRAIELAPSTGHLYYWRADGLIRMGQYHKALHDYTQALTLMPGDRPSRVGRGIALLWQQDWQSAVDELTPVIEERTVPDVSTAWAYRARGVAQTALRRPSESAADYQAYLALVPDATDRSEVEARVAQLHTAGQPTP